MFTPYDWQEGIGNRAQFVEGRLAQGTPVLAKSLPEGILVFTYRRQGRKIYEIYDRLLFGALGQQSDVEALRVAALEFASREGYSRSEEDVTIKRVATAMSAPIKKAFSDFSSAPVIARGIFGEVGSTMDEDLFYSIDYDGDYMMYRSAAVIAGTTEIANVTREKLLAEKFEGDLEVAIEKMKRLYLEAVDPDAEHSVEDTLKDLSPEALLLERSDERENRFRLLTSEEF